MLGRRAAPLLSVLLLAGACTSNGAGSRGLTGGASPAAIATTRPPSPAPNPEPSAGPSSSALTGPPDPTVCTESIEPTVVSVTIEDFAFVPAMVEAEAGEVITFSNTGFESHNATLDDGACKTRTLETGGRARLVFSATGTFAFHCTVHGWMTGLIKITQS